MITEPTRICETRKSLLDPVLISPACDVYDAQTISVDRKYSDHEETLAFVKVPINCNKTFKRLVWNYKNANFDTCNELISSFAWESILSIENTMDENCKNLTSKFIEIIKQCVSQKEVTIRSKDKVWFNSELRREIRKRDRLYKQASKLNCVRDLSKYKNSKTM